MQENIGAYAHRTSNQILDFRFLNQNVFQVKILYAWCSIEQALALIRFA